MSYQIKKHCQQLKKNYEVIKVRQFGHQTKKKQAHKHRTNWLLPQGSRIGIEQNCKRDKEAQSSIHKVNQSQGSKYRIRNTVNNTVILLYTNYT